jgi:Tol biopolymer transport system component
MKPKKSLQILLILSVLLGTLGTYSLATAAIGDTTLISSDSSGSQGNDGSFSPSISANGLFVAFDSMASNLVSSDTNHATDIFVRNWQSGKTTRVSVASDGTEANGDSKNPSISADGRFVAFDSLASNLVSEDSNEKRDVFVHDQKSGETIIVSMAWRDTIWSDSGNSHSFTPSISADGRFVAFVSSATNLVPRGTNGYMHIFVRDLEGNQTLLISVDSAGIEGNGNSSNPSISGDGRYVAFWSNASNLVSPATSGYQHIFVHDRIEGETFLISAASDGTEGNGGSNNPSITADGGLITFESNASNLVPEDNNDDTDIFVHHRLTGQTDRVSVASNGTEANHISTYPSISGDGRFVSFSSRANNMAPVGDNDFFKIFLHDRLTRQTSLVSASWDGSLANADSSRPSISGDGRYLAFESLASNLVPGDANGCSDVFMKELKVFNHFNYMPLILSQNK